MGRGDKRTRKGKIARKSFGNSRLRLSNLRQKIKTLLLLAKKWWVKAKKIDQQNAIFYLYKDLVNKNLSL